MTTTPPQPTVYHSVHLPQADAVHVRHWSSDRPESAGSVAIVHDIVTAPLPSEYAYADVLYTELPWRAGFAGYNERARVDDDRSYRGFLAAVSVVITDNQHLPAVIVAGAHAVPHPPEPDQNLPVVLALLPKAPTARALVYRTRIADGLPDNTELLAHLAGRFWSVGDFCCGYGWAGRIFAENGRRFVLSDYNPECIGHIAAHAHSWHHSAR